MTHMYGIYLALWKRFKCAVIFSIQSVSHDSKMECFRFSLIWRCQWHRPVLSTFDMVSWAFLAFLKPLTPSERTRNIVHLPLSVIFIAGQWVRPVSMATGLRNDFGRNWASM